MAEYSSFKGVRDLLDRVLASDSGVLEVEFRDYNTLTSFRQQIYKCRKLDRDQSKQSYIPGDPSYGISPYDDMTTTIKEKQSHGPPYVMLVERTVDGLPAGVMSVREIKEESDV